VALAAAVRKHPEFRTHVELKELRRVAAAQVAAACEDREKPLRIWQRILKKSRTRDPFAAEQPNSLDPNFRTAQGDTVGWSPSSIANGPTLSHQDRCAPGDTKHLVERLPGARV
jgi:hypothetical protein